MLRILTAALAFSAFSTAALAHPEPENKAPKSITKMERPQFPSKSEIQDALKQMPDMNAIMGDMMGVMKDERFRENMDLASAMEKHAPETAKKPARKIAKTAKAPKLEDLQNELQDLRAEVEALRKEKASK